MSRTTLERFVLRARRAAGIRGLVDVLVTGSEKTRALNRQFRGKDHATDVLSFPAQRQIPGPPRGSARSAGFRLGEIAISADIAAQNAARFGHSAAQEIKILTLHGILHLAGFDHERDNGVMARKELKLRQRLKLPVALIQRNEPALSKSAKGPSRSRNRAARRSRP